MNLNWILIGEYQMKCSALNLLKPFTLSKNQYLLKILRIIVLIQISKIFAGHIYQSLNGEVSPFKSQELIVDSPL